VQDIPSFARIDMSIRKKGADTHDARTTRQSRTVAKAEIQHRHAPLTNILERQTEPNPQRVVNGQFSPLGQWNDHHQRSLTSGKFAGKYLQRQPFYIVV
jgi:hypothetical protein